MKLIPFDPGEFLEKLRRQVEGIVYKHLPNYVSTTTAQIQETDTEVIVTWNMPACQDLQVYVDRQTLHISCDMQHRDETGDLKVFYAGKFQQKLFLPCRVKSESTRTNYQNGIVEVRIEKE